MTRFDMRTRTLGYTGERLTTIGFGTWAIGGGGWQFGWGPQDDVDSEAAIHRALDLGINWIDTARVYGLGHAETIVGRVLAERSEDVFVATKCGRVWKDDGTIYGRLTAESVREECESSLRRLGVDVIDLYQIHWPDPDEQIEEGWAAIAGLIEEGKVRYGGVSNFNVHQVERARKIHPVASLQPPYSMLRREVEAALLPYCAEHGIGVIAYSPMMAGLLTGKFVDLRVDDLPTDDWRRRSPFFREPEFSASVALVERLRAIARRNDCTVSQLAIAWVLRRTEVTSAIVGARRPSQIEETVRAGEIDLPEEDVREVDSLLAWRDELVSSVA